MSTKMRPYGVYKGNPEHILPHGADVADCQEFLLKGHRIRNKKAKRRLHNKMARVASANAIRKELAAA